MATVTTAGSVPALQAALAAEDAAIFGYGVAGAAPVREQPVRRRAGLDEAQRGP